MTPFTRAEICAKTPTKAAIVDVHCLEDKIVDQQCYICHLKQNIEIKPLIILLMTKLFSKCRLNSIECRYRSYQQSSFYSGKLNISFVSSKSREETESRWNKKTIPNDLKAIILNSKYLVTNCTASHTNSGKKTPAVTCAANHLN